MLAEVVKTKRPVRAMYRGKEEAGRVPAGAESVIADFADRASLRRALKGVDTVYLVCSPIRELVELEGNMIEACGESGVRHIVLSSALGAGDYPKSFPSWHRKVEDKLKASGIGNTILRPNSFTQNIVSYQAPSIRAQSAFYVAMGDARLSFIDARDVAAAAAKTLTSEGHAGKTYELNGPEALNYGEVAEKISKVAGRKVSYVNIPEEAQRKAMLDLGMPEWQVTALLDLQRYYTGGQGAQLDETLRTLLGRAPIMMDQFLGENADAFRPQAASA